MNDYETTAILGTLQVTKLQSQAEEEEDSEQDPWAKARAIAAHPINSYRMIRRFTKEFDTLAKHIWELNVERGNTGI